MNLTRRSFLGAGAGAALLSASATAGVRRSTGNADGREARNLIFMVADGMSIGTLTLADVLSHMLHGRGTWWVDMWSREGVYRAACATWAADSLVTDSAAAATTWSIGDVVNNGAICVTPDGRTPEPLLVRARASGKATGLITTTRVTHATPAGFIANVPSRNMEREIAEQIIERGVDVVLGGGGRYFPDELLGGHDDLRVVRSREGLAVDGEGRFMGLFASGHMAYELDRIADGEQQPSLVEMTRAGLARLASSPDGFVVQIEGGRVDHAAHANDAASLLRDMLAFDEALGVVLSFIESRDDTLLIVTTDHANANPGLSVYGSAGQRGMNRLVLATRSFDWILSQRRDLADPTDAGAMAEIVRAATGVGLSEAEREILGRALKGERVDPHEPASALPLALGSLVANHFGIAFASGEHTADFVEVAAAGPGAERLPQMTDLAGVHAVAAQAIGFAATPDPR